MSASARPVAYKFRLPIKTEDDLYLFTQAAFDRRLPGKKVCAHCTPPREAFTTAFFGRAPIIVILGSRGFAGKTDLLGTLASCGAALLGANVNILGGSGRQSRQVLDHITSIWKSPTAPPGILIDEFKTEFIFRPPIPGLVEANRIKALPASQKSARGAHPQWLFFDEVDEIPLAIIDAAMGQTMSKNGVHALTIFSSTRQYIDGSMAEILRRAEAKGWPLFRWCHRETVQPHGWLDPAEVERKKREVTATMWEAEYENDEPSTEDRAIVPAAIERMFTRELGEADGDDGKLYVFEKPQPEGKYAHGADWAKSKDWTIIITLRVDVSPARLVAFERLGRVEWNLMAKRLDHRIEMYESTEVKRGQWKAVHDATGSGGVVVDLLEHRVEPFFFSHKSMSKKQLLDDYVKAIEAGLLRSPLIKHMHDEHKFLTNAELYEEHLPDTVAAGALAWKAKQLLEAKKSKAGTFGRRRRA